MALAVLLGCLSPARGADVADVPSEDIFGFSSPTDVGNTGDTGFANENDGRLGKRSGGYGALNTKYEFSRTLPGDTWVAGSFFGAYYHAINVPGINDVDRFVFDGLSFEIEHRILKRSAGNPFAISLSIEPRWARSDPVVGQLSNSFGAGLKVFVDAVVVPDKLFWAANLEWDPQAGEDPVNRSRWIGSSTSSASTALALQISPTLFIGAETRYLSSFNSAWLTRNLGNALYLGPTFLWRITEKVSVNVTYQPQVYGHAAGNPASLDLDNFERAQFRGKIAVAF
jgi:hypothetical protein